MHNVGAVFRTADAFAIKKVYLCGITPRPPHREIRKTAIGAEESVAWEYHEDSLQLVAQLQKEGYEILPIEQATDSTDLSDFSIDSQKKYAVVLGHEITGVKQEIIDMANVCLEIPQYGTKHSLNISVTAGIVIYQMTNGMR